jgi:hypothetical protein
MLQACFAQATYAEASARTSLVDRYSGFVSCVLLLAPELALAWCALPLREQTQWAVATSRGDVRGPAFSGPGLLSSCGHREAHRMNTNTANTSHHMKDTQHSTTPSKVWASRCLSNRITYYMMGVQKWARAAETSDLEWCCVQDFK